MGSFHGRVETVITVIMSLIYERAMEKCTGMMDLFIKEIGTGENSQDLVAYGCLMIQ